MDTPHRRKLGKVEAYSLIEDYFSSGELPSVFYRRVGLSDNQFYGWRKRYLRDHPTLAKRLGVSLTSKTPRNASYRLSLNKTHHPSAPVPSSADNGFARVEVSDPIPSAPSLATTSSNHGSIYELCYPNGVVLRLPVSVEISSLSELIKLY